MTENAYGTTIPSSIPQTYDQAQAVIDTAIIVWEQMGLSTAQIMYGIAMMNLESGDDPTITNGIPASSIRGLGQFSDVTWNDTAKIVNRNYGFSPALPSFARCVGPIELAASGQIIGKLIKRTSL